MTEYVNAAPAKRFFVEMLIRDIRLEDAIIDLVDNAIDSLIRHKGIDLPALVTTVHQRPFASEQSHFVDIQLDDDGFCIKDNCGGIKIEERKKVCVSIWRRRKAERRAVECLWDRIKACGVEVRPND